MYAKQQKVNRYGAKRTLKPRGRATFDAYREGVTAPQAIGYKEIVLALEGAISLDEAVSQIKIATHRYANRQRSWFNRDKRIYWIDGELPLEKQVQEAALYYQAMCSKGV